MFYAPWGATGIVNNLFFQKFSFKIFICVHVLQSLQSSSSKYVSNFTRLLPFLSSTVLRTDISGGSSNRVCSIQIQGAGSSI
jgi:hypothetical protein